MPTWAWIVILAAVVVVVALAAAAAWRRRRSRQLQEGFGPEYERAVADAPTRREAEAELREREKRHEELELRPLPVELARRFAERWTSIQQRFVDDPPGATGAAHQLLLEVMEARGYSTDEERRIDDLSVDHPQLVQHYRAAMTVHDDGDTEALREAFVSYRALFDELLQTEEKAGATNPR
jgi:hypothetical protein